MFFSTKKQIFLIFCVILFENVFGKVNVVDLSLCILKNINSSIRRSKIETGYELLSAFDLFTSNDTSVNYMFTLDTLARINQSLFKLQNQQEFDNFEDYAYSIYTLNRKNYPSELKGNIRTLSEILGIYFINELPPTINGSIRFSSPRSIYNLQQLPSHGLKNEIWQGCREIRNDIMNGNITILLPQYKSFISICEPIDCSDHQYEIIGFLALTDDIRELFYQTTFKINKIKIPENYHAQPSVPMNYMFLHLFAPMCFFGLFVYLCFRSSIKKRIYNNNRVITVRP